MSPITLYVIRNLRSRPFVRALVVMSMIVVGATIGGVSALGFGLRDAFTFKENKNSVLVIERNVVNEKDSGLTPDIINPVTVSAQIKRYSAEALNFNMLPEGKTVFIMQLRGIEPNGFEMHHAKLLEGRMPEKGAAELLVGETLKDEIPRLTIGAKVKLLNVEFTVVGVFRAEGFFSGEAWTTRAFFQADPNRKSLAAIYLETANSADAKSLAESLSTNRALKVTAWAETAFRARSIHDFDNLTGALTLIFALLVTGAVFASASLIALLQQRRLPELCALRAIGFRSSTISMLIIIETEILVLAGGLLGILLVAIPMHSYVAFTLSVDLTPVIFKAPLTVSLGLGALAMMFMIGIGGAIVPIVRMRKTDISRGLREE